MAKRLAPFFNRVVPSSKFVAGALLLEKITKVNPEEVVSGGFGVRGRDGNHWEEVNFVKKESHFSVDTACGSYVQLSDDPEQPVEAGKTIQFLPSGYRAWPKRYFQSQSLAKLSSGSRGMSSYSYAGSESSEDEVNLEDGLSNLAKSSSEITKEVHLELIEDWLLGFAEKCGAYWRLTEDSHKDVDFLDIEDLLKTILKSDQFSLQNELDKWDEKGESLDQSKVLLILLNLRKKRLYGKALEFSKWLERKKKITFGEQEYASCLDLIAKVHGIYKAEKYIEDIPESYRGELIYRILLTNCATTNNRKRAEEVFNKMRDLGFPLTVFTCNQLLLLYKKLDKKKIPEVLLLMEKENIKPTVFTYRLLMDFKGQVNDIAGMEKLHEIMKEQGLKSDFETQAILARRYINGGLNEKAEAVLKEMEGDDDIKNRHTFRLSLRLYALLGKADEVSRIWKVCDPQPRVEECHAAIEAWGRLGKVEEAESVFERMGSTWKLTSKDYSLLMKVYAKHKMLTKGEELMKKMEDDECRITPWMCDALVELYVNAGEVSKAEKTIDKAAEQKKKAPFSSYMMVMNQYAKRGDVHNAEKIFHKMRQSGYVGRLSQYQDLLDAYVIAKAPTYGFRERMKADGVFPTTTIERKLAQVDAFMNKSAFA